MPAIEAYSAQHPRPCSRRGFFAQGGINAGIATWSFVAVSVADRPAAEAAAVRAAKPEDDILMLKDGSEVLGTLLDNWERATVDCTYADVPRELLQQKNKEELLEKASTFALFDKSASVVSCKTTNRTVRDYIGATGKGPLVGAEKRMRKLADLVDPDRLDDYFSETESFSQSLAKSSALSSLAGYADFESMNNFAKGEQSLKSDSNLEQAKRAIVDVKSSLDKILALLPDVDLPGENKS